MEVKKRDIRALTKEQLRDFFVENGDKAFRGNQVFEWLWSKSLFTFEDMTNISKQTREMLEANFVINHIKVDSMQKSKDGTIKNGIKLHDGLYSKGNESYLMGGLPEFSLNCDMPILLHHADHLATLIEGNTNHATETTKQEPKVKLKFLRQSH